MIQKPANTSVPIHDLLAHRWSPRAIDASRPVERKTLKALLEAARWAPSCYGDQPWRYLVLERSSHPDAWQKARDCLTERNQAWATEAPLYIVSFANGHFRKNGDPNRWGAHDTGAASENLALEGMARGLVVHQMAGFDAGRLKESFEVPESFTPMAVIAVGYPGDPAELPEDKRIGELSPRKRVPLGEIAFEGRWDSAFEL